MKAPDSTLWAGVCAGGYFAAAAVYIANAFVLATVRAEGLPLALLIAGLPVICALMGALVLAQRPWAPRWAVVVAAGFSAVHLVGLAYLYLAASASVPAIVRSLQWQLGGSFLSLWLGVLLAAFRLARRTGP
jgi:hypothetical protein